MTFALLGAGCSGPAAEPVQHHGVMREVMRDGRVEARARLADYAERGWYGVGALAGLQGEILIDDGESLVAIDSATKVERAAPEAQATLLTVARVESWREVVVGEACDLEGLERTIAAHVGDARSADSLPLPFVLEGRASALDVHVVRGACPHGAPVAGAAAPDRWSLPAGTTRDVRLVGFFAPGREGIVTHHGTALHVHALASGEGRAMGHVDALKLTAGARMYLPDARR